MVTASPASHRVAAIDPLCADTVEKVREPAVIGLFGSIRRRRGKLSD